MEQQRLVFLVGMPAAGKTWWGRQLADKYQLPFTDLDTFISDREQASIPALFARYGEGGFREREQKYLKEICTTVNELSIVACGGGTPAFADNMKVMKAAGIVIYLEADTQLLITNLGTSTEVRPLLNNRGDLAAYLDSLLQKRKSFYEQAHHILQAKDISLATFDKILSSCISGH